MKGETKRRILILLCYLVVHKRTINANVIAKELGIDWHTADKYLNQLSFIYYKEKNE